MAVADGPATTHDVVGRQVNSLIAGAEIVDRDGPDQVAGEESMRPMIVPGLVPNGTGARRGWLLKRMSPLAAGRIRCRACW